MKIINRLSGILTLGIMVAAASAWGDPVPLPVSESFESEVSMGAGWSTANAAVSYPSPGLVGAGNLSMTNGAGTATLTLDVSGDPKNVWWRGFAKVTLNDGPSASDVATAVAAFYVNSESNLVMRNGANWVTNATSLTDPDTKWIGYAVHLDYNAKQWDLYVDRIGDPDADLDKVDESPLAFNTDVATPTAFSNFIVKGEIKLDEVSVSRGGAPVGVNSAASIAPATVSYEEDVWYASRVPVHGQVDDAARLSGLAGDLLKEGMRPGDKIKLFVDGWQQYSLNAAGNWIRDSEAVTLPENLVLSPNSGIWRRFDTPVAPGLAFFAEAYNPETVAEQTYAPPSGIDLRTTNHTASAGWTMVTWTSTETRSLAGAGLTPAGVPGLPEGAVVFTIPAGSGRWYRSQFSGGAWTRYGAPSVDQIAQGEQVWVYLPTNPVAESLNWRIQDFD